MVVVLAKGGQLSSPSAALVLIVSERHALKLNQHPPPRPAAVNTGLETFRFKLLAACYAGVLREGEHDTSCLQ